jgi:hypothetical protein
MVSGIQVLGTLFGLVLSYFTFLNYKRHEFTLREFLCWEALWVCFIAITLFPVRLFALSSELGAIRPLDLFSVFGFFVVLSISFYNYVNIDRLRKQLEKSVRDIALADYRAEGSKKVSK